MKTSLKNKLYNLIKEKGEVSYGEICQMTVEEGYKVSTAERRLRELTEKSDKHPVVHIGKTIKKSKRNTDYIAGYYWLAIAPETKQVKYVFVDLPDGSRIAKPTYV